MKKIIRLTESDLHRIVKESIVGILNEIDATPPKRNKNMLDLLNYQQDNSDYYTDDIESDFPEEWLTDMSYYRAHMGTPFKAEKRKFDKQGFDEFGLHKETGTNRNPEGYNKQGLNKQGYKRNDRGLAGYDKEGYDKRGLNKDGTMYKSGRHNWSKIYSDFIKNCPSKYSKNTIKGRRECWYAFCREFKNQCTYERFRKIYDRIYKVLE